MSSDEKIYKVLYRKWRPKIFDDVTGQGHVVSILKKQIISKHIPHALMFCGVRGTGKTSCAKIFSKAVNCLNNVDGNPCLKCDTCQKIENGNILDVCEIDAASNNGVENIRAIREESNFVSSETTYKVYIVDEFHMLSSGAFNAFLRTLEEPPKNVIFILATTEFNKIPKTIISRCQKFDFRKIDLNSMIDRLKFISKNEKIEISNDALELICKNSEGSMRDALSVLDQCSNEKAIDANKIRSILGISSLEYLENLMENLLHANLKNSVELIENLHNQGKNLLKECEAIMNYFFDVFFYHCSKDFLETSVNRHDLISRFSSKIALDDSIKCFKILENSYIQMTKSINKKADLQISLVEICNLFKGKTSMNTKSSNLYDVENECNIESEHNNGMEPIKNVLDNSDDINSVEGLECWNEILDEIKNRISNSLFSLLKEVKPCVSGNIIIIDTNNFIFDRINEHSSEVELIIKEKTGKNYKIIKSNNEKKTKPDVDLFIDKALEYGIDVRIN